LRLIKRDNPAGRCAILPDIPDEGGRQTMPALSVLRKCKSCSGGRVAPAGHAALGQLAAEYVNDEDGLAPADFSLLAPLKRSAEYGRVRSSVTALKPDDAWSLEGLHYFVFTLNRPEGSAADPYALFVMNGEAKPVSALVIHPYENGTEAGVETLSLPGTARYVMQI